jgi:biopolymer transport protein ExbD
MKKTTKRGHGILSELNITPLLDLVFVLLVIFIITTPQMVNSIDINLPPGTPPVKNTNAPPKINKIMVDDEGKVFLNGDFVADDKLRDSLAALKAADAENDPKVVVNGSDIVDYQHMIKVLDALQQLDIKKIGLATQ